MVGYANGLVALGWKVIFASDMSKVIFLDIGLDSRVVPENVSCNSLFGNSIKVKKLLIKHQPCMLFTSMLTPSIICAFAKFIYGKRVKLVAVHGTPVTSFEKRTWIKNIRGCIKYLMVMLAYRYADLIISTSPGTASDIIVHFKLPSRKVDFCPNPLPLRQFPIAVPTQGDCERYLHFDFLCVSRLDENKNIEVLLKAFSNLLSIYGKITLCIVGEGPEKSRLASLAQTLGIESNVLFVGHTDDVNKYYHASRCFVLFSKSEEFGMVFIEALRCGLRCIANVKANGPRYIASLVEDVYLVDIDCIDKISCAMEECLLLSSSKNRAEVSNTTKVFAEVSVVGDHLLPCLFRHCII